VLRYRARISGPLFDRIDIQLEVPAVREEDLLRARESEGSAQIRARVERAFQRQLDRQGKPNADLQPQEVETHCHADAAAGALARQAITRLSLSARAFHRVLKLARTIADLAGGDVIGSEHMAEAVQYRRMSVPVTA
jgi:magnesium chelatase family protein